jgi:gluconate 2-dehydrogenase gamma chain
MKAIQSARREFLLQGGGAAAMALTNALWPSILSAAQHAQEAVKSGGKAHFEVLTAEQARNVEAITSQIIPTDDLPGAREAGVVFFIDHALKTFASDTLPLYQQGLVEVSQLTSKKFSGVKSFADATPEQQESIMVVLGERLNDTGGRRRRPQLPQGDFMQTIWQHTVLGFLAVPEAGGNRDYAGWKAIGRDPAHSFAPPFGFYDKDYPGWEAASAAEMEKK